jgi:hypothetical protein
MPHCLRVCAFGPKATPPKNMRKICCTTRYWSPIGVVTHSPEAVAIAGVVEHAVSKDSRLTGATTVLTSAARAPSQAPRSGLTASRISV